MLTKMYLTNFLSFKERTEFDFTASRYSILGNKNIYDSFLKGALFIGPNASGKSNALKGISFLVKMIKGEGTAISVYKCHYARTPYTIAEYEFSFDNHIVNYLISYNIKNSLLSEKLEIDNTIYIQREGNKGELKTGQHSIVDEQVDRDTLFLRVASFNTGRFPQTPILRKFMDYIMNSFVVDGYNMGATYGNAISKFAEEYGVDKINGYLDDFNYDFFVEYGSESKGEGLTISTIGSDNKTVFFKRKTFPIPNIIYNESQGNQVFANILPNLINVIENPGMIIIDEFGNSLHNKLAEKIIKYFFEHASASQMFITSHHTNLISNSVFRPDQIHLITFHGKDGSAVNRLSQFKPREAQNMEKMYLGGMFEGLPMYEKVQD